MKEHLVSVRGFRHRVLSAGKGRALVLLHGFTGAAETWLPFVDELSRDWRVIAPDLPGHGGTDVPAASAPPDAGRWAPGSLERYAGHLSVLLDYFDGEDAVVIGYSLGGRTGLTWAGMEDKRVGALVLEGASPGIPSMEERVLRREQDEALAQFIEAEGVEAFVRRWEGLPLFASQQRLPEDVRARMRRRRLDHTPEGLAGSLRTMGAGTMTPLHDRLSEMDLPVLLMAGALDEKYCELAQAMARRLPRATVHIVPDAGHNVHMERPEAWLEAILPFLRQVG